MKLTQAAWILAFIWPSVGAAHSDSAPNGGGAWEAVWTKIPSITVVSSEKDDRVPLVREAVDYWNKCFTEMGTPFRLGSLARVTGEVAIDDLDLLGRNRSLGFPESVNRTPGDIIIALSDGDFISFSIRWPDHQKVLKVLVGIRTQQLYPLALPNVTRNVIAHELGHAIGLVRHNYNPTMLMCGRPALCRPDIFAFNTKRFFPLTKEEEALLLKLYPPEWRGR